MSISARSRDILIKGGTVVSVDPSIGIQEHADVLIRDGIITDIGRHVEAADADMLDASHMIVMPGLVETHFHMWSSLGRNFIAEDFEYFPAKWATAALYEPEDFYRSVLLGLVECANAGITTVHNWSHNTRTPAHADAELRAHHDGRLRARYAYGHPDGLDVAVPLDFSDVDRVGAEWFGADSPFEGRMHLGVNLRGPDLGDMGTFHQEMAAAQERALPVAIHTMQGASTKVSAAQLERDGYLGPDFLIAHFLAATDADREAMARADSPLSFSVHSELRLGDAGDARAALLNALAAGVHVSFSIDATSICPVDLFAAMSVAWNMGIPWEGSPSADLAPLTFGRCIEMATLQGARALGIADVTGSLTPGKRADVITIRTDDLNVAPVADVESTIVRSVTPANVDTVIADGVVVKSAGRLLAWDVDEVVGRAQESAMRIRRSAGGRLAPS